MAIPEVGSRFGPYELVSVLGVGGMGKVFLARDAALQRNVAIKVINESTASQPNAAARFEREARLASSLNHPNIVTIYGVGEEDGVRYIAMELVEGSTLRELIGTRALPLARAVDAATQIATALAKAHAAGIVHRDLKPQNVMITGDGLVKVLDFGLGTLKRDLPELDSSESTSPAEPDTTAPGALIGTSYYMSPEQASGRPVDFRSDQFAFGSMLYEMVSGRRAFDRPTPVQTLSAIIEDMPQPLDPAGVPPLLGTIIARCLSKRPDDRYASTQDLAHDMRWLRDQLASGWSATDSHDGAGRGPTSSRRFRLSVGGAAVLVVVLALTLGAPTLWRSLSRTTTPTVAARQPLAVLPFRNIGDDAASQAFCDGLVEAITSQLTQISSPNGSLAVVPATEVRREGISSARDAQRVFGVTRVVTGSVQRSATRIRVAINVVDTATLRQLDARSIDFELENAAASQDAIVREVAGLLGVAVRPEAAQTLTLGTTKVPGAYDLYLQARGHLQRRDLEHVDVAIALLERTVAQDANYALAHAGLGEAYWLKYELTKDAQWVQAARASSTEAIGLANGLAPAHVTLGLIEAGTGRLPEAVAALKRAVTLDPSSDDAHRELANAYQLMGRTADAEAAYKKAIDVRPNYWLNYNSLGRFYFRLSRYAEAEAQYRRVIALAPEYAPAYASLGGIHFSTKRYGDAEKMFEKSIAVKPTAQAYSNLGTLYFSQGRYGDAARSMEQALGLATGDSLFWNNLASAYYWAPGERDKARAAYEKTLSLAQQEARVNPKSVSLMMRMADCYSRLGQAPQARALVEQALAIAPPDATAQYKAGELYEQLGDRERALQWIRRALTSGYSRDVVERSPGLAALRTDPRFAAPSESLSR